MIAHASLVDNFFPRTAPVAARPSADMVESLAFSHALMVLSAQLAAIDGYAKPAEYAAFESLFVDRAQADPHRIRAQFDKYVTEKTSLLQYARQLHALTASQPRLRQDIFVRFVRIATADGLLNAAEMEWLRAVGKIFDLAPEFVRLKLEQCFTRAESPYVVLQVDPQVSDAELRVAYMARVQALHPDRYQAAGASAETIAMLSQQLATVNAAYAHAVKARQKKHAFSPTQWWQSRPWARNERSAKATAA